MPNYVTKAEVHAAADRVDADGKKPSATNVRETIGRGSNSTIAEHLKTWRPRDQAAQDQRQDGLEDGIVVDVRQLVPDMPDMGIRRPVHREVGARPRGPVRLL